MSLGFLRAEGGEEHLLVGEADGVELGDGGHDLPHVAKVEGAMPKRAEVLLLQVVQDQHRPAQVTLSQRSQS